MSNEVKYNAFLTRSLGAVMLIALIFAPAAESAQGFFGLFPRTEAQGIFAVEGSNSQNLLAMESSLSPDKKPEELLLDVEVIDDSALSPNMGPSGTTLDFAEDVLVPEADEATLYIVKSGDTLAGVAKMFGVSANTIVWANNLDRSKALKPGQEVLILPVSGVRHTVKKGDTLASIAKKYKGDSEEIKLYNDISDSTLTVGSVVIVPNGEITAQVSSSSGKGTSSSSRSSEKADSSGYIKPTRGIVTQWGHGRFKALDIGNRTGTPIYAVKDGKVIAAKTSGYNGGYGLMVIVDHGNGVQTLYAHMSKVRVSVGDSVTQGQQIGDMGSTGRSTGPHLHFETRGSSALATSIYKK